MDQDSGIMAILFFFLCLALFDQPKCLAQQEHFLQYVMHFFNPNM